MKQRIRILLLVAVLLFSMASPALAADSRASEYIKSCSATLSRASGSGELTLSYSVRASSTATRIGIETAKIYKADGTYFRTIYGSTTNGLIATNTIAHSGSYTSRILESTAFYMVVTFSVTNSNGTGTSVVTTQTVTTRP